MMQEVGQRLGTNSCGWESPGERSRRCWRHANCLSILCSQFKSGGSPAPLWPSDAFFPNPPSLEDAWRPLGARGEATVARGPPFSPHVAETSETFFLRPFFLLIPALLFFHVCGVEEQFLFKSWVLLNLGIHWILQGDVSDTSFIFSLHRIGTVHLPV